MADHIKIRKAGDKWTIRSGGAILGESTNALELDEVDYAPVIYFPREDIAMALLERTEKTTHCPHKGDANYYSIINRSSTAENVVWTYETPIDAVAEIKNHLAFKVSDSIKVEQI